MVLFHIIGKLFIISSSEDKFYPVITLSNTDDVTRKKKNNFEFLWLTWAKKKVLLKQSRHIHLLTLSVNKSIFSGSKMGQTKHKRLRTRNFCRFAARNCGLYLKHIFFKIITRNTKLLCTSNIQILKFLKDKSKTQLVSKSLFRLLGKRCCG